MSANPPTLEVQQAALQARVAELEKAAAAAVANQTNQQKALEAATAAHAGMVKKLADTKNLLAKANADKAAAEQLLAAVDEAKDDRRQQLQGCLGQSRHADKTSR